MAWKIHHTAGLLRAGDDVAVHDEQRKRGHRWEAMGLSLVAVLAVERQPETHSLPDDALGRAIQAAWIGRKVPSPAMSIVPILGPRVDLLKDCIFTASVLQLAACAEDEGTRQR